MTQQVRLSNGRRRAGWLCASCARAPRVDKAPLPVVGKGAHDARRAALARRRAALDHVADDPLAKLRAEEEVRGAPAAGGRRGWKAYKQATKAGLASADAAPVWLKLATVTAERDEEAARKVFKHMKKQRIGVDGADFYLRWAAFEGKQGEREKERDILESAQALGDAIDQRAVQEALEQAAARDEQEHTLMGGLKGLRSALDAAASDEKTEKLERYQLAAETTEKVPQYQLGAAAAAASRSAPSIPAVAGAPSAAGVDRRSSDESRTSEDSRSTEDDGEVVRCAPSIARAPAPARAAPCRRRCPAPPPLAAPAPRRSPRRRAGPAGPTTGRRGRRAGEPTALPTPTTQSPCPSCSKTAAAPAAAAERRGRAGSQACGAKPTSASAGSAARRSARRPTTTTRRRAASDAAEDAIPPPPAAADPAPPPPAIRRPRALPPAIPETETLTAGLGAFNHLDGLAAIGEVNHLLRPASPPRRTTRARRRPGRRRRRRPTQRRRISSTPASRCRARTVGQSAAPATPSAAASRQYAPPATPTCRAADIGGLSAAGFGGSQLVGAAGWARHEGGATATLQRAAPRRSRRALAPRAAASRAAATPRAAAAPSTASRATAPPAATAATPRAAAPVASAAAATPRRRRRDAARRRVTPRSIDPSKRRCSR